MGVIDKAVSWAVSIADDDSHEYSQSTRWGPHYDCSSFVITAYTNAGVDVKGAGASYTGDMYTPFINKGFKNVTSSCKLSNGEGLKKGDVLLSSGHHAALVRADGGAIVHASSPKKGICCQGYYNYPWDFVLRYQDNSGGSDGQGSGAAKTEEYMYSENSYEETKKEPSVVWNNRTAESAHAKL